MAIEKILYLKSIDPVDLYGINDTKLDKIKTFFPKMKIIARGSELKLAGEDSDIQLFEEKIEQFVKHFDKYNSLTVADIEKLMFDSAFAVTSDMKDDLIIFGNSGKPIRAQTPNQRLMVEKARTNDLIFAIGPSGTGKTYTAIALAVRAFKNKEVKRIILSRPAVEAGENLGFLPGDLKEKLDPYLQALYDALYDMVPPKKLDDLIEDKTIQIAPLAFMRGRTLDNAYVILDEAQNATQSQIKMFLTRMGANARFIVTGDLTQIDLPYKRQSGLEQSLRILKNIDGIAIINFNDNDILRHRLVRDIVDAYEKEDLETQKQMSRLKKDLGKKNESALPNEKL
jgi:phosphate starvation-inducible protein PhoH and related proteins